MNVICLMLILGFISFAECAKILAVFPSPGYSQFILGETLMTELVRRGHEVTVISPYKPKVDIENYRAILVDGLTEVAAGDLYQQEDENIFVSMTIFESFGHMLTEYILAHQKVQELIHSNETFDIVIVEQFSNEAHMGFATHFNAPLVLFSSIGLSEWNSHLFGNVRLPSANPVSFSPYSDKMTYFQRLHNAILSWFDTIFKEVVAFPHQQELLTKYFPKEMNLKNIMYNASIMLMNSHATTTHPTALTTSIIEIGGFHISPKKLPAYIQKFLDEAHEGVIYFSMGTNLKSADLPKETLNGILRAFSKLKQKVLWKFEDQDIPNKPKNLLVSKWMPQIDILAHPNVVAFITHGGLLSTTEAIYFGVPMIGIPIFGDQKMNVARSVQKQIAVHLPFKDLSEDSLSATLKEILTKPKYARNARQFSDALKDQIVKPLDLAVFWLEYVARHGGAPQLRNASIELHWFQLYLVDVICFLICCILVFYCVTKLIIKQIFRAEVKPITTELNKKKIN